MYFKSILIFDYQVKPVRKEEEINAGFVLEWHTPGEVFDLIKNAKATDKRGGQQMLREKILLEY